MLQKLLLIFLLAVLPSPLPGKRVHDLAGVLSGATEAKLEAALRGVEERTTAEVAVVTLPSLQGQSIDAAAYELFNSWGVGKEGVNNGVLFLIAPSDRRARIEVGYGLEPLISDGLAGEILDNFAIPSFKQGKFPEGIEQAALEIVRILDAYPDAARGVPGSAPRTVSSPRRTALSTSYVVIGAAFVLLLFGFIISYGMQRYSTVVFVGACAAMLLVATYSAYLTFKLPPPQRPMPAFAGGIGAGLLALFYNARKYLRFGPRRCSRCGSPLILLSETDDDQKLSEVQKLEEKLGGVNYDVWYCAACLTTDVERYVSWFSGFSACPKCSTVAYKEESTTLKSATRYSTGLKRITGTCVSCAYTASRMKTIPRITSSSSGSGRSGGGGGFGGGSSGGGGASRGW